MSLLYKRRVTALSLPFMACLYVSTFSTIGLVGFSSEEAHALQRPTAEQVARANRRAPVPKPIPVSKVNEVIADQHKQADQDRNGYLTMQELRGQIDAIAAQRIRERFAKIDTDGNSAIGLDEFSVWQRSFGSQALNDTTASGRAESLVPKSLPFKVSKGRQSRIFEALVPPLNVTILSQADADYDGNVSVAELQTVQRKRFNTLDKNKDTFLTFNEFPGRQQVGPRTRRLPRPEEAPQGSEAPPAPEPEGN